MVRADVVKSWADFLMVWNPVYKYCAVFSQSNADTLERESVQRAFDDGSHSDDVRAVAAASVAEQGPDFTTENKGDEEHVMLRPREVLGAE